MSDPHSAPGGQFAEVDLSLYMVQMEAAAVVLAELYRITREAD